MSCIIHELLAFLLKFHLPLIQKYTGRMILLKYLKIYLETDLKIILFRLQNYVGRFN